MFTAITDELPGWNRNGFYGTPPLVYIKAVRPPQIADVAGVGLVAGLPLGLVAGRVSYRVFATSVGVLPRPVIPLAGTVVLIGITLATGLLAASGPGRRAVRTPTSDVLRER